MQITHEQTNRPAYFKQHFLGRVCSVLALQLLLSSSMLFADTSMLDECFLEKLALVPPETSVLAIKEMCDRTKHVNPEQHDNNAREISLVSDRLGTELQTADNPFSILPHKPNYVLPLTFTTTSNGAPFERDGAELDKVEIEFQLSLKFPIANNLIFDGSRLFVAYTGLSFWQAYNQEFSSPFRETNHEPEVFFIIPQHWELFDWKSKLIALGVNHQSNGQTGRLSRSWNRVYANFIFEREGLVVSLRPWLRIPENEKKNIEDSKGDDNPDIEDFMGNGELTLLYKQRKHTFGIMLRNNFKRTQYGAVEVSWSFPLKKEYWGGFKGYVKYFNGYGESLIDYNSRVNRIGVGIAINDWL